MTKRPSLGVHYKFNFKPVPGLQMINLFNVVTKMYRSPGSGRMRPMPYYTVSCSIADGTEIVAIDQYKSDRGHDEIFIVTEDGKMGWLCMHVPSIKRSVSFTRVT